MTSLLLTAVILLVVASANAQTTTFSYQGKLADGGNPANGQFDFQFKLFDTATVGTGTQRGSTVVVSNITVTAGIFTTSIDFGACATCFDGSARFLEIAVKQISGSTFTTLGPRQPVTSNPYAIRSLNSITADGLSVSCVNCITSSQIQSVNGSAIAGPIPVASVPPGSANYIQNNTSQQATANFNISGDGTAGGTLSGNVVNAATQYNIGGLRILSNPGALNLFAGQNAGQSNTTGEANTFVGVGAGGINTTGNDNTYVGAGAGAGNSNNSSFGSHAGANNSVGSNNTFIGAGADAGSIGLSFATAIGAGTPVSTSNTVVVGRSVDGVRVPGTLLVGTLDTAGTTSLCRNASNRIAGCSSSLRYKTNIQAFIGGLNIVRRLRPIAFTWKDGGMRDFGFAAEEVENIEPLLTFRNDKGEIEGVKYDRFSVVFVNAFKEQQAQLMEQQAQIKQQQQQIEKQKQEVDMLKKRQQEFEALKALVCADHPAAGACTSK